MIRSVTLVLCLALFSCKALDKDPDYENEIARVTEEIANMVEPRSCVAQAQDCRLKVINGSDACGPAFTYNINDVDSDKLLAKFTELERLKNNFWESSVQKLTCYYAAPDTTFIENCQCVAGYKNR
jgi:hypothetical protein